MEKLTTDYEALKTQLQDNETHAQVRALKADLEIHSAPYVVCLVLSLCFLLQTAFFFFLVSFWFQTCLVGLPYSDILYFSMN